MPPLYSSSKKYSRQRNILYYHLNDQLNQQEKYENEDSKIARIQPKTLQQNEQYFYQRVNTDLIHTNSIVKYTGKGIPEKEKKHPPIRN